MSNVRDVAVVLDQLKRLYEAGGATGAAKDLGKLVDSLTPHGSATIESYLELLASAQSGPSQTKPSSLDGSLVERCLRDLVDAGTNEERFTRVFSRMTTDRKVKMGEAQLIAQKFTHRNAAFKTKKAAFEAIRLTFVERARFENKLRAVS